MLEIVGLDAIAKRLPEAYTRALVGAHLGKSLRLPLRHRRERGAIPRVHAGLPGLSRMAAPSVGRDGEITRR